MNNTQRITALENRFDAMDSKLDRLLAAYEPEAPAKVTRPAPTKARKAPAKPATGRCLTRKNRPQFVKAHAWAKGLSTQVIASMCVEDPSLLKRGWTIGERYTEMFSA